MQKIAINLIHSPLSRVTLIPAHSLCRLPRFTPGGCQPTQRQAPDRTRRLAHALSCPKTQPCSHASCVTAPGRPPNSAARLHLSHRRTACRGRVGFLRVICRCATVTVCLWVAGEACSRTGGGMCGGWPLPLPPHQVLPPCLPSLLFPSPDLSCLLPAASLARCPRCRTPAATAMAAAAAAATRPRRMRWGRGCRAASPFVRWATGSRPWGTTWAA